VVSFVNHVTVIPEGLPSDEAASILCAVSRPIPTRPPILVYSI
jgi:hypothetical protein